MPIPFTGNPFRKPTRTQKYYTDFIPKDDIDTDKALEGYLKRLSKPESPKRNTDDLVYAGLASLSLIDALLPAEKIDRFKPVQPQETYNQHPYGTGSQAIMQHGGPVKSSKGGTPSSGGLPPWLYKNKQGELHVITEKLPTTNEFAGENAWMQDWVKKRASKFNKFAGEQYKVENPFMSLFGASKENVVDTKKKMEKTVLNNLKTVKYMDGKNSIPGDAFVPFVHGEYSPYHHNIFFPLTPDKGNVAHETAHAARLSYFPGVQKHINETLSKDPIYKKQTDNYLKSPSEIYSRIFALRRTLNLKPEEKVTPELIKKKKEGNYFYNYQELDNIMSEDSLIKLMNDLVNKKSSSIPKANAGGSLSSSKAKEMLRDGKANGRKLTKKQKKYFGMVASGKAPGGIELPLDPNDPKYFKSDPLFNSYESLQHMIGAGGNPLQNKYGKMFAAGTHKTGIDLKERQALLDSVSIHNQANPNMSPEDRVASFFETPSNNPIVQKWREKFKSYGYGPREVFNSSPNIETQALISNSKKPVPYVASLKKGGELGGNNLNVNWGGDVKKISFNPYDGGTIEFKGDSHTEGGMGISYGNKNVEVEGGETGIKDSEGTLHIMGNMYVPGTKSKFKTVSKKIAEKEEEYDHVKTLGSVLVNTIEPKNGWDKLKFNAGEVMMKGGDMGQRDLITKKQDLTDLQRAMLDTAQEFNLDPEKFSQGENRKAKKGTWSKAASGEAIDPTPQFAKLKAMVEANLKALYPNQKVKVVETGAERDISEQRGLRGMGASKTSVSLHNLGGARDYLLYVDGKLIKTTSVYKKVVQEPAKELGLHPIGDWDAGHISAVQEGKGRTFADLLKAHPDIEGSKSYEKTVDYLFQLIKKGEADKQEIHAYNQLTGSGVKLSEGKTNIDYKKYAKNLPKEGTWFNQNFIPTGTPTTDDPDITLTDVPLTSKPPIETPPVTATPPYQKLDPPSTKRNIPTNQEGLHPLQVLPEIFAFAQNKEEPVPMQQYTPDLFEPYQVTYQERRNDNTATFNALSRQLEDNPAALANIAAQKYQADGAVGAEEFRTNQGISNEVTNKNIALLNDAELKNLSLADQQMVRQSQAKSNTKAQNQLILNSLAGKYLQNRSDNRRLSLYENLYNYRFDEEGKAQNYNPDAVFNIAENVQSSNTGPYATTKVKTDAFGLPKETTTTNPSEKQKKEIDLKLQILENKKNIMSMFKNMNKGWKFNLSR